MQNNIHCSAIIGRNVKLGVNNTIGPNVVIQGNVTIGDDNLIGVNTMISNNVIIGNGNKCIGAASIGSLGEMGTKGDIFLETGKVVIGNNNLIREFVTINSPVRKEATRIGDNCYLMARTHIPHDADVRNNIVMATNSLIGGGTIVYDHAYIGLGSITHQWTDIGESAMIGLQAAITKHVPPFCTITGIPGKILKLNRTGLERRGFAAELLDEVENNFKQIILGQYFSANEIIVKIGQFFEKYPGALRTFVK
jgi:UDP-N-acetylglucosamine acyltransferase